MRLTEVTALAWSQVDMAAMTIRIDDTKSGEPLDFPITRQLAAILERRFAEREQFAREAREWVFPSEAGASGHLESIQHLNARIGEAGGTKFWFHALCNCFITFADPELRLPTSLTKRLVNHAPSQDITEGYAADWTMEQLRNAVQRIADRIDELTLSTGNVRPLQSNPLIIKSSHHHFITRHQLLYLFVLFPNPYIRLLLNEKCRSTQF